MDSSVIPTKKNFLPDLTKRNITSMRNKEHDTRYKRHYEAALMRKDGYTIGEIAEKLDVHTGTVLNWLNRMVKKGLNTDYKIRQGRPPKFTRNQLDQLEVDMKKDPNDYGIDAESWTSRVVASYVKDKFDVSITPGSMRRIMTRTNMDWPGSAAATLMRKSAQ